MNFKCIYITLYTLLSLCLSFPLKAQVIGEGDSATGEFIQRIADGSAPDTTAAKRNLKLAELAYNRKDFAEALRQYQYVLITYPTAATYYNLALCYSHTEQVEQAILHYEKALLIEPTMKEARHNLRLLYAQTKDALSDGRALPIVDEICYAIPASSLAYWILALFVLGLVSFLLFRLSPDVRLRRLGFYSALSLGFLWLFALAMLWHQYYYQGIAEQRAIVITRQDLKPTPTGQGNTILTLHEGTAVLLEGEALGHWQEVRLGDGRKGWLPLESFARVRVQRIINE